MYSVDIDVGGTLTDGIFSDGTRLVCAKVDSTPHDLTVCLFDCLAQGAAQTGFSDVAGFLEQVELLRWSTTITSNVLAELRGPKIGLIVSKGHEQDLYGSEKVSPILNHVVDEKNIIGMDGVHGAKVLAAVRSLLENGVRRICISLEGALHDPAHELQIKRIIGEQYPDHYLGSVPVLTGTDICQNTDDMTRTYYAVINAYTHSALAATLFKAEDELRYTQGYARAFLISHINGGVAGVSKTRAIDTMESGPVLGIYGAAYMAKLYGIRNAIALDVGGTTAKMGVIRDGEPVYSQVSDLFGIPVRVRLPYLRSIALGGGSVVKAGEEKIRLGPESMGSFPGPACYGLGGDQPTLTDAFVAAGLIDPRSFLGGTKQLDADLARQTIADSVARKRRQSLDDACAAIIERAFTMVGMMIETAARELKLDLADHVLFAYGGNGGLMACGVAEKVCLRDVYLFALGPVFSAFGSSASDISHVYERSFHLLLQNGANVVPLNELIEQMRATGLRDLLGEGITVEGAECALELELSEPGCSTAAVKSQQLHFSDVHDLRRSLGCEAKTDRAALELVRMRVTRSIAKPILKVQEVKSEDASQACAGRRRVALESSESNTQIYDWEKLWPGNKIAGCSILAAANCTYFVPAGWVAEIDQYGNAHATQALNPTESASLQGAQSCGKH